MLKFSNTVSQRIGYSSLVVVTATVLLRLLRRNYYILYTAQGATATRCTMLGVGVEVSGFVFPKLHGAANYYGHDELVTGGCRSPNDGSADRANNCTTMM